MGSDVRIRTELSELTEFPASLRCEACQTHHRQCLMRESDGRCVQCGHAGDDCFFTRVVKFKAPRASFRWDTLLGLGEETATVSIDVHGDGSPRNPAAEDGAVTKSLAPQPQPEQPNSTNSTGLNTVYSLFARYIAPSTAGGSGSPSQSSPVMPNPQQHDKVAIPRDSRRVEMKEPLPVDPLSQKRLRTLEPDLREHAAKVRKLGACKDCAEKAITCQHMSPADSYSIEQQLEASREKTRDLSLRDPPKDASLRLPPIRTLSKDLKGPNGRSRRSSRDFICREPTCTRNIGFTTRNDLLRHLKAVHGVLPDSPNDRSFKCAGLRCPKKDKLWHRQDNFKSHIRRMHPNEDLDELVKLSAFRPGTDRALQITVPGNRNGLHHADQSSSSSPSSARIPTAVNHTDADQNVGKDSLTCVYCNTTFYGHKKNLSSNLRRHHQSACPAKESETPSTCPVCQITLTRTDNLVAHMRKVHGSRNDLAEGFEERVERGAHLAAKTEDHDDDEKESDSEDEIPGEVTESARAPPVKKSPPLPDLLGLRVSGFRKK